MRLILAAAVLLAAVQLGGVGSADHEAGWEHVGNVHVSRSPSGAWTLGPVVDRHRETCALRIQHWYPPNSPAQYAAAFWLDAEERWVEDGDRVCGSLQMTWVQLASSDGLDLFLVDCSTDWFLTPAEREYWSWYDWPEQHTWQPATRDFTRADWLRER